MLHFTLAGFACDMASAQVKQGLLHDLRFYLDSQGKKGHILLIESITALGYAKPTLPPVRLCIFADTFCHTVSQ